jgi:uncharacterized protein (TIRG00374 family)
VRSTKWSTVGRVLLAFAFSGGLLALLLSQLDARQALEAVRTAAFQWVAVAALCSFGVLLTRGLRFRLLTTQASFRTITCAVAVQYFLLRVTPMRLGDFSLPVMLARYADEPPAHTLVSLVVVRLAELWVVVVVGVTAIILAFGAEGMERFALGGPAIALLTVMIATFGWWMQLGASIVDRIAKVPPLASRHAVQKIATKLRAAVAERASLSTGRWAGVVLTSVAVVALQFAAFAALLAAFHRHLSVAETVVGVSVAYLVSSVPFVTVGTIGTYEAGWVLGFTWVGMPLTAAVLTAVATQVITLFFTLIFAIPAWLMLQRAESAERLEPASQLPA